MPDPQTTDHQIPIGPDLGRVLDVALGAGLSVLLSGRHGIGKSEYLEEFGAARGRRVHVLDLSLLEATDLTGLPLQSGGRTHFAPPAHLPSGDEPAMLVLEELNRCDRSVRQPCLQLLTARRLNDYRLPADCFVVACVNPVEGGYDVDELDAALASRFMKLEVTASRERWAEWARRSAVLPEVIAFVERHAKAFDPTPPRSWTYASSVLRSARERGWADEELPGLLRTVLGESAALALVYELGRASPDAIDAIALLRKPDAFIEKLEELSAKKRLDILRVFTDELIALLRGPKGKKALSASGGPDVLRAVLAPMPADLREKIEAALPKG